MKLKLIKIKISQI